jgi:hypothetical protein
MNTVSGAFAPHVSRLACVRVQTSDRNTGRSAQRCRQGCMGDENRLQHVLGSHCRNRIAQRDMDADQHRAQRLVGQHHAHGHLLYGHARMLRRLGLQQLSVAGKINARQMQRLLVQRRGHQAINLTVQGGAGRPLHAGGGGAASLGLHLAPRQRSWQAGQWQHRQAARRYLPSIFRLRNFSHWQAALARYGQHLRGAAQGSRIAQGKAAFHALGRITKSLGDDFRANPGRIALGNSQQRGALHGTVLHKNKDWRRSRQRQQTGFQQLKPGCRSR